MQPNEKWLTPVEAARVLRLSPKTMERMRQDGTGPTYCRIGRRILYSVSELDRFLAARAFRSTAEY